MSNYIEIQNDHNKVVINDSFKNLSLLRSTGVHDNQFVLTDVSEYSYAKLQVPKITNTLYCFEPNSDVVSIAPLWEDATKITYGIGYQHNISDINPVRIHIFNYNNNLVRQANCGLEIINAHGEILFNSDNKYLRILDCILSLKGARLLGRNDPWPNFNSINRGYGKRIGIIPLNGLYADSKDGDMWEVIVQSFYCHSGSVMSDSITIMSDPNPDYEGTYLADNQSLLIVNLAGV